MSRALSPVALSPVALAVGALYAVIGALELALGQDTVFTSPGDYVIEWLFVAALVLSVGLLATSARASDDRITAAAWAVATVGHVAIGVAALVTAVAGRESLDALFPVGVLLVLIGLVAVAVQDLRRRVSPPRGGLGLAGAFVLSIPAAAVISSGSLVLAAGWLAFARLAAADRELTASAA